MQRIEEREEDRRAGEGIARIKEVAEGKKKEEKKATQECRRVGKGESEKKKEEEISQERKCKR